MKVGKQLLQHETPLYTGLKNTPAKTRSSSIYRGTKKALGWTLNSGSLSEKTH